MKIVFLSHFYPPTHNAGIEQNTHALATGLRAMRHSTHVLCCGDWQSGDSYFQGCTDDEWQGVPVRRLHVNWTKAPRPHQYLYDNPFLAKHVRAFLTECDPDVVHVTSLYALSAQAILETKSLGIPVVFTLSDFWTICPRHTLMRQDETVCDAQVSAQTCQDCLMQESSAYRAIRQVVPQSVLLPALSFAVKRPSVAAALPGVRGWGMDVEARRATLERALGHSDVLLAPSDYVRRLVGSAGHRHPITLSPYGNDLSWLDRYRRRSWDGVLRIGYIGQIKPLKGLHVLVEAFIAGGFGKRAELVIHGEPDEDSDYVKHLRASAIGAPVRFMGGYQRDALPTVLGGVDVIVVPSIWPEVAGLVVQEAFAAGLPVVASTMGGLPEFVRPGHGGLLFEPSQRGSLKEVLVALVDGGIDLLNRVRDTIPPVRTTREEVSFLLEIYKSLVSRRRSVGAD